jgi:putative alpha-1,2-mannosidase
VQNATSYPGSREGDGKLLSGYALLPLNENGKVAVTVRVGTSFISVDQARRNIDAEIPDNDTSQVQGSLSSGPQTLERTAHIMRAVWTERLDMFALEGATEVQKEIFWTGVIHALQVSKFCSLISSF